MFLLINVGSVKNFNARLVNPANRRKLDIIIVGTGLAGASGGSYFG